ncbi:hypothetical protein [Chromobacterium sp. Beijing]|uniref:hypothetical protein n=1 Tax=Chromobacterium sp. Beijing TaxID=2735795 RepID=UPI001F3E162C|nr:hypothetical protein [Chromobacterium sp. Beijing]UJB33742.1 hypothetical protein HQN78_23360 [Chromobacterium sp. Beijing]
MENLLKTKDHRAATDEEVELLELFAAKFEELHRQALENDNETVIKNLELAIQSTNQDMTDHLRLLFGDEELVDH